MYDYHIHTDYTRDSHAKIDEVFVAAKEKGLKEICFTQHLEPHRMGWGKYSMQVDQIPVYCDLVREGSKKYGVTARIGLEVGYEEGREKEVEGIVADSDVDFVIGSVHCVGELDISVADPEELKNLVAIKNPKEIAELYFAKLAKAVEAGDFDVMAHFDVVKRNLPLPYEAYEGLSRAVLEKLADTDMGLEINTSGWRQDCKEQYPAEGILKCCSELGIKRLTIGSDAHEAKDVAYRWGDAAVLAKKCGFDSIYTFKKRKPSRVKL